MVAGRALKPSPGGLFSFCFPGEARGAGRWDLMVRGAGQAVSSALVTTALIVLVQTLFARNARRR